MGYRFESCRLHKERNLGIILYAPGGNMRKGLWTVQLRNFRNTHPAGVLFYTQEGYDCVEEAFPLRVSLLPVDVEITGQYGGRSSVGQSI